MSIFFKMLVVYVVHEGLIYVALKERKELPGVIEEMLCDAKIVCRQVIDPASNR